MRVDIEKFLIVGPEKQKEEFFERVQKLGIVEFINTKGMNIERAEEVDLFVHALHILRRRVPVKEVPTTTEDVGSAIVIARDIVDKNERLEFALEEKRILQKEIARVEVFGDFSVDELRRLEEETGRKFQFFFTKRKDLEAPKEEGVFYIGNHFGLDYYFTINKVKTSYEGFIEMTIDKSLGDLSDALADTERKIDHFSSELSLLSHHKKLVKAGLYNALNHYHLKASKEKAENALDGHLFTAYGYIPKNKVALFNQLATELEIYFEPILIEEGERVPTYLENKGFSRLGEDLVGIYDTPSHKDRDPSLWVYVAFGLFFSMIIGDAGYGAILLLISLFLLYKFGKKGGLVKRTLILSTSLSIGCIIWGVITASYFGLNIPPDSKLRSVSFIDWMVDKKAEYLIKHKTPAYQEIVEHHPELKNVTQRNEFVRKVIKGHSYPIFDEFADNVMMEIVIFIGTLHIIISLLRYADRNWAAIGWVIFMVGAYLYFPSLLKATSLIHYIFGIPEAGGAHIGLYLLFGGIILATLLALIQKKWAGLAEPMQVISVFADVMSYLRIYALALAGVIMAQTFNNMGSKLPLIFGILIIFAGHTVNFTLALMGGLIHGLRLNFIEWYHYSFEGGGKPFNPLSLHEN